MKQDEYSTASLILKHLSNRNLAAEPGGLLKMIKAMMPKQSIRPSCSKLTTLLVNMMLKVLSPIMLNSKIVLLKWAASSEFVSSSIPSWQTLTAHAQPFRGARDLAFCLKVPLDSLLVWASSEGSGETARMRRLAWTFAARIGYKYQIRLTRSK